MECMVFRSAIISADAQSWGRKRFRVAGNSEKKTPRWNHEVKESSSIERCVQALSQDRSASDLQSRHNEARKAATSAVKKSNEKS